MRLTAFERRWRDAVIGAVLPLGRAHLDAFWPQWDAFAPWTLAVGLRVAVWSVTIAGVRYGALFHNLTEDQQNRLLSRIAGHPAWHVRQLAVVLKLVAAFAAASDDTLRLRLEPR